MSDLVKVRCRCIRCDRQTTRKTMRCADCDAHGIKNFTQRKVTKTQRERMGKRTWEVATF